MSMALLMLATVTAAQLPRTFTFTVGSTPTVSVRDIMGDIKVEAVAGDSVTIDASAHGGDAAARARWAIEATGDAGHVDVRVRCAEGEDRHCRDEVAVNFKLRVPKGSRMELHGVASDVTLSGVTGPVRIQTVSGDVVVTSPSEPATQLEMQTVSGELEFAGACGDGCRLRAHTVSGDINLHLDAASNFDLRYQALSGDLRDDLGLTLSSSPRRHRSSASGRYRGGGGEIDCNSVSGDLKLARR